MLLLQTMDDGVPGARWTGGPAGEPGETGCQRVLQRGGHVLAAAVCQLSASCHELPGRTRVHRSTPGVHQAVG